MLLYCMKLSTKQKLKFVNFIRRIIKTFTVFPIYNTEYDSLSGQVQLTLGQFFLKYTEINIILVYFKRASPHGCS